MILERHQKSGVPLRFEEAEDISPLLRRRLDRTTSRDKRQEILKTAFFDRLYQSFGQNIHMALLQWIRSIRMEDDDQIMVARPVSGLNLSFFSRFNMDQTFALKALLEHGQLSPDAYAAIDRMTPRQALAVFETLGNALVIEAMESSDPPTVFRHVAVQPDAFYRIRPLFANATIRLLRERNVVH